MIRRNDTIATWALAAAVTFTTVSVSADVYNNTGPGLPGLGTVSIATGNNPNADGYLSISPDEYGSWASTTFGGSGDIFNPAGGFGPLEATFTSGLFMFGSGQRELLSDSFDWQNTVGPVPFEADGSLNRLITGALSASDTSGNGIFDTLMSSFHVEGGSTDMDFGLTQHVASADPGVAFLQQTYAITNNGPTVSFDLVRAFDADLFWSGDFIDDEVGTNTNGSGLDTYVFQQEVGNSDTAITLSSPQANGYYGGKNGVTPPGGPPFGYGTDVQVWDAFGTPTNWLNHIAGVGSNTNGTSGAFPPGSAATADGFMGLNIPIELAQGDTTTVTLLYTYGSDVPVPEPASLALLGLGAICLLRRRL